MAGLKGITVNTAPEAEPHIYAEDDAAIFQAMFGEDGVSSIGQACKATVLSNNKVRIADGVLCVGGHFARIPYGEYVDCEIANGQSGKNRNDIIVAKFVTTGSGGIDTMTCEVKQGTASTTATDPTLTQNDIYKGGKIRELPLYRVKLEGLNITAVEQLFTVNPTNKDLSNKLTELNGNKPSFFHHELLWSGKLASKKTATGMSPNWSKYTLFVCRFDGGVSMALGIRCKDDSSSGWKDWIRFIGGNDSGSATDVYVASVMISGNTITASGVGSHALTSTGCPGVDRIMCEIYGII